MAIYNVFLNDGPAFEVEVFSDRLANPTARVFTAVVYRPGEIGRLREPITRADGRPLEFLGANETDALKSACAVLATIYSTNVRVSTQSGIIACQPPEVK